MKEAGWHATDLKEVMKRLSSCEDGLSEEEAQNRLVEFGPNELRKEKGKSPWSIFFEQFKDFLILLLLAATLVSLLIGELFDAAAIMAIVVMSAFLGFLQEYRAERALEALKEMAAPSSSSTPAIESPPMPGSLKSSISRWTRPLSQGSRCL
jgi:Ca2+-transporting ATPase